MDCSMPGFPVHHQLPEPTKTHVHWVNDAIQPSHPLSSPYYPAFNLSQHQGLFKWVRWGESVLSESVWNMLLAVVRKKLWEQALCPLLGHGCTTVDVQSVCGEWSTCQMELHCEIVLLLVTCFGTYLSTDCCPWKHCFRGFSVKLTLNWPISYIGRVMIFLRLHLNCYYYYRWTKGN